MIVNITTKSQVNLDNVQSDKISFATLTTLAKSINVQQQDEMQAETLRIIGGVSEFAALSKAELAEIDSDREVLVFADGRIGLFLRSFRDCAEANQPAEACETTPQPSVVTTNTPTDWANPEQPQGPVYYPPYDQGDVAVHP